MIAIILFQNWKKKELKWWQVSSFITSVLGFIIMIAAPGNFGRAEYFIESGSRILIWMKRFVRYTIQAEQNILLLIIILVIFFCINYYTNKKEKKNIINITFIFFIGSIVGIYSMILAPTFPDRAWFGLITFLIIAISYNFNCLVIKEEYIKKVKLAIFGILFLSFIIEYTVLLKDIKHINQVYKNRENKVIKLHNPQDSNLEFKIIDTKNKRSPLYTIVDLGLTPEENINAAQYYGVKSIVGKR